MTLLFMFFTFFQSRIIFILLFCFFNQGSSLLYLKHIANMKTIKMITNQIHAHHMHTVSLQQGQYQSSLFYFLFVSASVLSIKFLFSSSSLFAIFKINKNEKNKIKKYEIINVKLT